MAAWSYAMYTWRGIPVEVFVVFMSISCATTLGRESDWSIPQTAIIPAFTRDEILGVFRSRVSLNEWRNFRRLIETDDANSKIAAMQMVLFKLTTDELVKIGVTQVEQGGRVFWSVAWSLDNDAVTQAVFEELESAGIGGIGSCGLGAAGWYVEREDFFAARKALLGSQIIRSLEVKVVEPKLRSQ